MRPRFFLLALALGTLPLMQASCGGDSSTDLPAGTGPGSDASVDGDGAAGTGGTAGGSGSGGTGGVAGKAGAAGAAGEGGAAGTGEGGAAGTGEGGTAGTGEGGTAGTGEGGTAGDGGMSGAGGDAGGGGDAGTAGGGGDAGTAGGGGGIDAGADGEAGGGGQPEAGVDASMGGSGGAQDGGTDAAVSCATNADCLLTEFCSKTSCLVAKGTCTPRPIKCDGSGPTVCGCDGVSYWNDCLRQLSGEAASTAGECTSPASCGGLANIQCPNKLAVCAYLFEQQSHCSMLDPMGECWVLPETCPTIVIGGQWRKCSGPSIQCLGECDAMKAGGTFYRDTGCPM